MGLFDHAFGNDPAKIKEIETKLANTISRIDWLSQCFVIIFKKVADKFNIQLPPPPVFPPS